MPKQLPSHVGLVPKIKLAKQLKNAYIKGDTKAIERIQAELRKHKK